jgi:hypothetical protein
MNRHMPSFFDKQGLQLLLFGGKGGVGKTTCATAAALRLSAQVPKRSLLLVSTDPAHSVRDSLAGCALPGNLQVLELNAQQCMTKFREQNGGMLREIAAAGTFLDDEDINQFLSLSLGRGPPIRLHRGGYGAQWPYLAAAGHARTHRALAGHVGGVAGQAPVHASGL